MVTAPAPTVITTAQAKPTMPATGTTTVIPATLPATATTLTPPPPKRDSSPPPEKTTPTRTIVESPDTANQTAKSRATATSTPTRSVSANIVTLAAASPMTHAPPTMPLHPATATTERAPTPHYITTPVTPPDMHTHRRGMRMITPDESQKFEDTFQRYAEDINNSLERLHNHMTIWVEYNMDTHGREVGHTTDIVCTATAATTTDNNDCNNAAHTATTINSSTDSDTESLPVPGKGKGKHRRGRVQLRDLGSRARPAKRKRTTEGQANDILVQYHCNQTNPPTSTSCPRDGTASWAPDSPMSCLPAWPSHGGVPSNTTTTIPVGFARELVVAEVTRRFYTQHFINTPHGIKHDDDGKHAIPVILVSSSRILPYDEFTGWAVELGLINWVDIQKKTSVKKVSLYDKNRHTRVLTPTEQSLATWMDGDIIQSNGDCNRSNLVWVGAIVSKHQNLLLQQAGIFLPQKLRAFCKLLNVLENNPHWHEHGACSNNNSTTQ